ncbi:MAG: carotenoid biosynthesis protein [Bacteroidota bacterium]
MFKQLAKHKVLWAIGIIWLFHASAIFGITLGYFQWFIQKTPLNLIIFLILFFWVYPIDTKKKVLAFLIFFFGGIFAEWLGVNFGLLFGNYTYGQNLGPKLDGVPYLIGALWALLTFICAGITDYFPLNKFLKILCAALLMVLLDFFMEQSAHLLDFWTFEGDGAPFLNYATWFLLAVIFQLILRLYDIKGNRDFSLHTYLSQLVFFLFFYFR